MCSVDYAKCFQSCSVKVWWNTKKGVDATLHVDTKVIPRCFKPRQVPLALRSKVEIELDGLQAQGMINGEVYK